MTEKKIYFYLLDKQTLEPKLENIMNNFMKCSTLMFSRKRTHGISYKMGQQNFIIYGRTNEHNFKV